MNLVQHVLELSDELVQVRRHVEHRHTWDHNRNKKSLPDHVTYQPGLLAQLYDKAMDPERLIDEGGSPGKPKSRPPLAIEALSRWLDINVQVRAWCYSLAIEPTTVVEDNIRLIGTLTNQLDADTLEALISDLKTWRRWAAVMTGWETKVFVPDMECPVCSSWRSIRVSTTEWEGFCCECQHAWIDEPDIRNLATRRQMAA